MKKVILFAILSFTISFSVNSQSIDALDAKNGYKDFKIGDSFEKYNGKLIFRNYLNNDQNRPTYSIKKEFSYSDLFGYTIKDITLTFKADKLIMIDIWLKEIVPEGVSWIFNTDDFTNITDQFKSLFGEQKYHVYDDESDNMVGIMQWKGKKVELWVRFVFRGTAQGGHYIKVTVIDALMLNRSSSDF